MTVDVVKGHNSRQLISFLASGDSCFLLITLIWVQTVCKGYQPGADPEGGDRGSGPPPGKSQVTWVSIGNKQLDPPWKMLDPLWNLENDSFL